MMCTQRERRNKAHDGHEADMSAVEIIKNPEDARVKAQSPSKAERHANVDSVESLRQVLGQEEEIPPAAGSVRRLAHAPLVVLGDRTLGEARRPWAESSHHDRHAGAPQQACNTQWPVSSGLFRQEGDARHRPGLRDLPCVEDRVPKEGEGGPEIAGQGQKLRSPPVVRPAGPGAGLPDCGDQCARGDADHGAAVALRRGPSNPIPERRDVALELGQEIVLGARVRGIGPVPDVGPAPRLLLEDVGRVARRVHPVPRLHGSLGHLLHPGPLAREISIQVGLPTVNTPPPEGRFFFNNKFIDVRARTLDAPRAGAPEDRVRAIEGADAAESGRAQRLVARVPQQLHEAPPGSAKSAQANRFPRSLVRVTHEHPHRACRHCPLGHTPFHGKRGLGRVAQDPPGAAGVPLIDGLLEAHIREKRGKVLLGDRFVGQGLHPRPREARHVLHGRAVELVADDVVVRDSRELDHVRDIDLAHHDSIVYAPASARARGGTRCSIHGEHDAIRDEVADHALALQLVPIAQHHGIPPTTAEIAASGGRGLRPARSIRSMAVEVAAHQGRATHRDEEEAVRVQVRELTLGVELDRGRVEEGPHKG
mmetsp:Transcript_73486/g.212660  ORF Transcript_73486/g.212660 Transcript_73486/m.212660 type:complete len:594 (+) Transcript_73486:2036-3817(+)